MLAKTEAAPAAVEEKRRTVTLTNRRPVTLIESEWPVVAEGKIGDSHEEYPERWSIDFRVRMDKFGRELIHGKFNYENEFAGENGEWHTVRVGRLLDSHSDAEKALFEVGNEMRERMICCGCQNFVKHVTTALDRCFASLGAQVI